MVDDEDKQAMKRILEMMNGSAAVDNAGTVTNLQESPSKTAVELAGPGQVTSRDVQAMADVLRRLNTVVDGATSTLIEEGRNTPAINEAMMTTRNEHGVKIGMYQIVQNLQEGRLVGKQTYSVVNKITNEMLACDLGLYEAAHGLVKLLNSGKFVNSPAVRELLEAEASYTSHKIDAGRYKKLMKKAESVGNASKKILYEDRMQASIDRAMQAKKHIKTICSYL